MCHVVPATEWCNCYLPCYIFTVSTSGLLLFHVGQSGGTEAYLVYPISDIGRRLKFGEASCTERIVQGNDFELIPTVKMETRHPFEGYFGSEFPAMCNHCGVIVAAWSSKTLKCFEKILRFLEKRPLTVKFSKLCSEKVFITTPIDVLHLYFVKYDRREIGEIVRYLPDRKRHFAWLSSCCHCADRAQNLPGPVPDNKLWVLQISLLA